MERLGFTALDLRDEFLDDSDQRLRIWFPESMRSALELRNGAVGHTDLINGSII
jgi:hypothetical protein